MILIMIIMMIMLIMIITLIIIIITFTNLACLLVDCDVYSCWSRP